jgi:tripartite-type tricarboxylate transporter receptor subunit TctC
MDKKGIIAIFVAVLWIALMTGPAYPASPFYEGKTVHLIVGTSAGGGFDTYSRMIARHMGKHVPGNPTIIVENMTGAAFRVAAKHLNSRAKPDGLTIGNLTSQVIIRQILGDPSIDFDMRKFEYIGVPVKDNVVCAYTKASGITSMEQLMAAKTPVKTGGIAPGDVVSDVPRILKATLNLPLQVVDGYKGTSEIRLAAESGEVAGTCFQWESMRMTWSKGLTSGDVSVVLQATDKALPDLPNVPLAVNLAKSEEGRQLIRAGISSPASVTRLYLLPPGTPKDRVMILRKAFQDTLKDPEFLAEAKKSKLSIDPIPGEEVERIVNDLFNLNPALVSKLKEILHPAK